MSDESTNQPDQQPEIQDDHSLIGKEGYFKSFKYGAPELQRLYNKYFSRGLIIAISIYLLLIGGYVLAMYIQKVNADEKDKYNNIITLEDLDLPPSAEEEPPPPDVEIPDEIIPLKDLEALIPEPVPKQEAEILTMKTQEKLEEINAPVSSEGDEILYFSCQIILQLQPPHTRLLAYSC